MPKFWFESTQILEKSYFIIIQNVFFQGLSLLLNSGSFRLVKFLLLSPVEWEWKQGSLPCTLNFCIYSFGVLGLVILLVFP